MSNHIKHLIYFCLFLLNCLMPTQAQTDEYPSTRISNEQIVMKLYLPDPVKGYYRATRFDWSGIIYSLEFQGHQYFGEWKTTHDPLVHEDITGPAESFGSAGPGYNESGPENEFIRIGVGILEKIQEPEYVWNKTYKILDNGIWKVDKGPDWIEFKHELKSKAGWGYIYTKKIELMKGTPGFSIVHKLTNTGQKTIETDQFNHNFFMIDHEITGPAIQVKFPFKISSENNLMGIVKFDGNKLNFLKKLTEGSIWLALNGYGPGADDHQFEMINIKTGAGVRIKVDKPLYRLVFWAKKTTICPENFIKLKLTPGEEEIWISDYALFIRK